MRSIDYDHMGGEEYIAYVRNIAEQTFGKENVKDVDVNAVYDGNYCTIDWRPLISTRTIFTTISW